MRRRCKNVVRGSREKPSVFASLAPVPMGLVADDQIYFLLLKKSACRMNDVILVSRYCQTIHDGPYAPVAELLVAVHGSCEHDGPTTGSGTCIDQEPKKTRIACGIAEAQDLTVATRQQGIGVAGPLLDSVNDFVNLVSEVTDNGHFHHLCRAPHPKVLSA